MKYLNYLLFLILLIPTFLLRDYTPDNELRYLSIADEALRNNSFFTFYNHGVVYADKPPLYLWLIMLGKFVFGMNSMLYLSLLSLIPTLVILIVMDKWITPEVKEKHRVSFQLMLLSTVYYIGSGVVLRMDMMMTMFIVLALYTFYKMYTGQAGKYSSLAFPVYIFLAIFTKGPVGILVPLFSVVVFLLVQGKIKTFGRYWEIKTWGVLLVGCTVWFSLVYAEGGKEYLNNLLFNQTVNRAIDSFHHKRPFYYYFVSIWYVLAPWSLLYIGVILTAIRFKRINTDMERLFLTVSGVTLIMLSSFSSKVDIYLLPSLPFFAGLTILMIQKRGQGMFVKWLIVIPVSLITLAAPVVLILICFSKYNIPSNPFIYIALSALFLTGLISLYQILKNQNFNRSVNVFSYGLILTVFTASLALPVLNEQIGYGELCKAGIQLAEKTPEKKYFMYNLSRGENIDVYLKKEVIKVSNKNIENWNIGKGILFYRTQDVNENEFLKKLVTGKEHISKGNYTVVLL